MKNQPYFETPNENQNANGVLEVELTFCKPHYGNNMMFLFKGGQPRITIGPHWPLSLCLAFSIIAATCFISFGICQNKALFYKLSAFVCGSILLASFLAVVLKNPGVNFTLYTVAEEENSCKPCKLVRQVGTVHCMDCDICVRKHDHHCPWVGKCIGEGNMLEFQLFLVSFMLFFLFNIIVIMA